MIFKSGGITHLSNFQFSFNFFVVVNICVNPLRIANDFPIDFEILSVFDVLSGKRLPLRDVNVSKTTHNHFDKTNKTRAAIKVR